MPKPERIYIRNGVIEFQTKGKNILKYEGRHRKSKQIISRDSLFVKFCSSTSIRGLSRINKNKSTQEKSLWIIFVLTMSALLSVGTLSLCFEYLEYNTLINSRENHEIETFFPDVTFCNLYPFHIAAKKLWESSQILSPLHFNDEIRKMMKINSNFMNYSLSKLLFTTHTITSYFETIGPENAKQISHDSKQILYCFLLMKNSIIKVGHHDECGIKIETIPDSKFLTCQQVKVLSNFSKNAVALGIIIHMDNISNFLNSMELGLVQAVFRQTHGIRMILHEPETLADLTMEGFNVEPGKFTEVKFGVEKWTKMNTPKELCWDDEMIQNNIKKQLKFKYTYQTCQNRLIGERIFEKCKCVSSKYPLLNYDMYSNVSFCSKLDSKDPNKSLEQMRCIEMIESSELLSKIISQNKCARRCNYMAYNCHLSSAQWVSSTWHLNWLMMVSDIYKKLTVNGQLNLTDHESVSEIFNAFINPSQAFTSNQTVRINTNTDLFLAVNRQSFMTMEKIEVFSLTSSALLSRLGGLSSITLGITFTTIFEIVEFILVIFCNKNKK